LEVSRTISSRVLPESLKEPYLQVKRVSKETAENVENMDTRQQNVQKGEKNSSATIVNSKVTPKNSAEERPRRGRPHGSIEFQAEIEEIPNIKEEE
jgi:alpha-galactosidase/6-phospho-beta-glucosidase family protein